MPTIASPGLPLNSDRAASSSQSALAPPAPINGESSSGISKSDRPIKSPQELVEAYKRNGTFDSMRTELLRAFIASPQGDRFSERIEDIIADHFHYYASRSPTRISGASSSSLPDSASTMRELERHTAYSRAEDDLERYQLDDRVGDIEDHLTNLLKKDNNLETSIKPSINGGSPPKLFGEEMDGKEQRANVMVLDGAT